MCVCVCVTSPTGHAHIVLSSLAFAVLGTVRGQVPSKAYTNLYLDRKSDALPLSHRATQIALIVSVYRTDLHASVDLVYHSPCYAKENEAQINCMH